MRALNTNEIPEHRFTRRQIAALVKLLDPESKLKRSQNLNDPAKARENLENAGRWFTSSLVMQNAPTHSQEIEKLGKIVAATKRVLRAVADSDITPYLRFEAGDALPEDHKLQDLTSSVLELMQLAESAVKRKEKEKQSEEQYKRDCEARGLEWSKPKFGAMRVLVQHLYLQWWNLHGKQPSGSLTTNFMKFALAYVAAMQAQTGKAHRAAAPNIDEQLGVVAPGDQSRVDLSIQSHVRTINEQLAKRAKEKSRGKPRG